MTIILTPTTEARLREKATRDGQDIDRLADSLLQTILNWEEQEQKKSIEGVRRGLASSDAGRVRPFAEFAAEMRAKYDLPTHLSDEALKTVGTNSSRF